jgi:hypothetical protein
VGLFLVIHGDRFQVFGLKDLTTVQAVQIIYTISAGNHLGSVVSAGAFHNV